MEKRSAVSFKFPAESKQFFEGYIRLFTVSVEIVIDHTGIEKINSGRYGGVRSEYIAQPVASSACSKLNPFPASKCARAQSQKRRMPFVHVMDGRSDAQLS